MVNKFIKQRDIKVEDLTTAYPDVQVRISDNDIELQQMRDVVSIAKEKIPELITILTSING